MDWPAESFAKSVTRQRFQELINSPSSSTGSGSIPLVQGWHDRRPDKSLDSFRARKQKHHSADRFSKRGKQIADEKQEYSTDSDNNSARLRRKHDTVRTLDETRNITEKFPVTSTLRRPRRQRADTGVSNSAFELDELHPTRKVAQVEQDSRQTSANASLRIHDTTATPNLRKHYDDNGGKKHQKNDTVDDALSLPVPRTRRGPSILPQNAANLQGGPQTTLAIHQDVSKITNSGASTMNFEQVKGLISTHAIEAASVTQNEENDNDLHDLSRTNEVDAEERLIRIRSKAQLSPTPGNKIEQFSTRTGNDSMPMPAVDRSSTDNDVRIGQDEVVETAPETELDVTEGRKLALHIHRTDKLITHHNYRNVVVRISVVDAVTGKLRRKSPQVRDSLPSAETTNYDQPSSQTKLDDYIKPMTTKTCDLSSTHLGLPSWDERLVFEFKEKSDNFFRDNTILFFEVMALTFDGSTHEIAPYAQNMDQGNPVAPSHIAWAFLKLPEKNRASLIGRRLRLQLYFPDSTSSIRKKAQHQDIPLVCFWWKSKQRIKYPSTLFMSMSELALYDKLDHEKSKLDLPDGSKTYTVLRNILGIGSSSTDPAIQASEKLSDQGDTVLKSTVTSERTWNRQPNQPCLIPHGLVISLECGVQGSSVIKFSHDGRHLACGALEKTGSAYIALFDFPSGQFKDRFSDCRGIIYDLDWSYDDSLLLAASADCTVRISDATRAFHRHYTCLPHPTFVYSARFCPNQLEIIATGCYDGVIRIWRTDRLTSDKTDQYTLLRELTGHDGFVNVLVFHPSGRRLFSAGKDGLVRRWEQVLDEERGSRQEWSLGQSSSSSLTDRAVITDLQISPRNNQLVSLDQNGNVCFRDKESLLPIRKVACSRPFRLRTRCTVTPCGSHVYVGTMEGTVQVIDVMAGKIIASIPTVFKAGPANDIAYHPFKHAVAFCGLRKGEKVMIWAFEGPENKITHDHVQPNTLPNIWEKPSRNFAVSSADGDGNDRDLFSPDSAQADRLFDVIHKLNSITDGLKARQQQRRQQTPEISGAPSLPVAFPVKSPHWSRGFLPNFSQI